LLGAAALTGLFALSLWIATAPGGGGYYYLLLIAAWAALAGYAFAGALVRRVRDRALRKAVEAVHERPESFSLVLFHGQLREQVVELIEEAGFQVLERIPRRRNYSELVGGLLAAHSMFERDVLYMAIYEAGPHTVLLDFPVLSFRATKENLEAYKENLRGVLVGVMRFADDKLAEFCERESTVATVASWDRVMQLIILRDVSRNGVTQESVLIAGQPIAFSPGKEPEEVEDPADPALRRDPSLEGLRQGLRIRGVDLDQVFGSADAWVLKVRVPDAPLVNGDAGESNGEDPGGAGEPDAEGETPPRAPERPPDHP